MWSKSVAIVLSNRITPDKFHKPRLNTIIQSHGSAAFAARDTRQTEGRKWSFPPPAIGHAFGAGRGRRDDGGRGPEPVRGGALSPKLASLASGEVSRWFLVSRSSGSSLMEMSAEADPIRVISRGRQAARMARGVGSRGGDRPSCVTAHRDRPVSTDTHTHTRASRRSSVTETVTVGSPPRSPNHRYSSQSAHPALHPNTATLPLSPQLSTVPSATTPSLHCTALRTTTDRGDTRAAAAAGGGVARARRRPASGAVAFADSRRRRRWWRSARKRSACRR